MRQEREILERATASLAFQRSSDSRCQTKRLFAWRSCPADARKREDLVLLAHLRSAFARPNGTCGIPRMSFELPNEGLTAGRCRLG
jgi:hypothetical protein